MLCCCVDVVFVAGECTTQVVGTRLAVAPAATRHRRHGHQMQSGRH